MVGPYSKKYVVGLSTVESIEPFRVAERGVTPVTACVSAVGARGIGCQRVPLRTSASSRIGAAPVPSEFMIQMSEEPPLPLRNTIRPPSGDQLGVCDGIVPTCANPVPSGLMTCGCRAPPTVRSKRILDASGDHCGPTELPPGSTGCGFDPSAFMTWMTLFEKYAIRVPSGENSGPASVTPVLSVRRSAGAEPSAFMTKISSSGSFLANTIFLPSGEKLGCDSCAGSEVSRT